VFQEKGHEMCIPIQDDSSGKSAVQKHVFDDQIDNAFSRDCFVAWDEDGRFATIVISDG